MQRRTKASCNSAAASCCPPLSLSITCPQRDLSPAWRIMIVRDLPLRKTLLLDVDFWIFFFYFGHSPFACETFVN